MRVEKTKAWAMREAMIRRLNATARGMREKRKKAGWYTSQTPYGQRPKLTPTRTEPQESVIPAYGGIVGSRIKRFNIGKAEPSLGALTTGTGLLAEQAKRDREELALRKKKKRW